MADYEFRYSPLTGRLTGKQMIEQTEQAINQLSSLVDSAAGQVEIISTLANEANENAATALEVANEALSTTGRTYITVSTQTDANNYYDSQLIYIADSTSTNIPVADTGMLEVKTNDNKTACEQVFIADSNGDAYYRNGAITSETVGDVTTYTVTWGGWSSQPASQTYVQQELTNYLPLSGGTVSGDLTVTGNIAGSLVGNVTGLASGNLPLSGGMMNGSIQYINNGKVFAIGNTTAGNVDLGWNLDNREGAGLGLRSTDYSDPGEFSMYARDTNNTCSLTGKPNGSLTWGGNNVLTDGFVGNIVSNSAGDKSVSSGSSVVTTSVSLAKGVWVVTGHMHFDATSGHIYGAGLTTNTWFGYIEDGGAAVAPGGSIATFQVTRIFSLASTTTVKLVAYTSGGSATAKNNIITAVRIA